MITTRFKIIASFAAVLLIAQLAVAAPTTQPVPLPTANDLKEMHDAGQYRTCLQQIARLLFLRGDAAKPYDRYALLLLRGDCLLHLEDRVTALDAYTAAEKSPEPKQLAEARATALLIRRSTGLAFTPKSPAGAPPIDIVDHQKRKAAMLALMEQLREENKTLIESALNAKTLVPIMNAAPILIDLHALELTATGSTTQIHPTLAAIGEHARELISSELTVVDQRITSIEHASNEKSNILFMNSWWGVTARRGLTTDDRDALRRDADYADKITATTTDFQRIARSLGSTGEKWEPIIRMSSEVTQHARDVLAAE